MTRWIDLRNISSEGSERVMAGHHATRYRSTILLSISMPRPGLWGRWTWPSTRGKRSFGEGLVEVGVLDAVFEEAAAGPGGEEV